MEKSQSWFYPGLFQWRTTSPDGSSDTRDFNGIIADNRCHLAAPLNENTKRGMGVRTWIRQGTPFCLLFDKLFRADSSL